MIWLDILAQTTAPSTQPTPPGIFTFLQQFGPMVLILLVFYFFIFGNKRKQGKERKDLLSTLKKGDRVQTIGGILGTIVEARDEDVTLKVDESSNTKIRFTRSAIHKVMDEESK